MRKLLLRFVPQLSPLRLVLLFGIIAIILGGLMTIVLLSFLGPPEALKSSIPLAAGFASIVTALVKLFDKIEHMEKRAEARHRSLSRRVEKTHKEAEAARERADEAITYHREGKG